MTEDLFGFGEKLLKRARAAEEALGGVFAGIDAICEQNQAKVLNAFQTQRVSEADLGGTTGYGYDDRGRDTLDRVFAQIVGAQDALVRHNFVSGTHALTVALFGVLRPGDKLVCLTGSPYDTMEEVIGLRGAGTGSLKDFGVLYEQVSLNADGTPDMDAIRRQVPGAKVAYIQRSRGYSLRPSLLVEEIGRIAEAVKAVSPDTIVLVDNCYGEFVETLEPTQRGADLIVGSLIKNAGGGIAKTGGYIAGRRDLVALCAYRLTSPGTGKEVGCTLGENRAMFMGLFFAPAVVAAALKTSCFALKLFSDFGFQTSPAFDARRADIISTIALGSPQALKAFCAGIQSGAPVDSFVTPEGWDMPGYASQVIMAAGAFTQGASIELSADAPMRDPYAVWLQGGLTYPSGKIGVLLAAKRMMEKDLLPF